MWKLPKRAEPPLWERGERCGAQMKTGMQIPDPPTCILRPGHFVCHQSRSGVSWPLSREEYAARMAELEPRRTDDL